jgi:hypothetical protein
MDTVVNKTMYIDTSIVPGHNYIYQVMEKPDLIAGNPNSGDLTTSWSEPWTVSVMLLEPFWVQEQPWGRVFLKWKPDSLLQKNVDVQSYLLLRKSLTDNSVMSFTFGADDTTFMDNTQLLHENEYAYKILALDSLDHVVAVNNDTITCDTGAVYIPEVLHITCDPEICPVRFFNRDDSIRVKWRWRGSNPKRTVDDTRGAVRITLQVSVSDGFPEDSQRTVTESMDVTFSDTMMVIKLPPLVSNNNNKIWFRIAGFDAFDNPEPPIWSNEFFTQKTAIYDPFDPYAVQDLVLNSARAYDSVSDTVIVDMSWSGQGVQTDSRSAEETLFNVHGYFLVRACTTSVDTVTFIRRTDAATYSFADTVQNRESIWAVVTKDCAGNLKSSEPMNNNYFLQTPSPPLPDSLEHCIADPGDEYAVPVEYYFEIAMDSSHFYQAYEMVDTLLIDRILSRSKWSSRSEYRDTTGWAEIVKSHTWFRVKVRRSPDWESAWSLPALFDTASVNNPGGRNEPAGIPLSFKMEQNYPNPFNNSTLIQYQMPVSGQVTLKLYNINGRLVKVLMDKSCEAGYHSVDWDGRDSRGKGVATGIYLLRIAIESPRGELLYRRQIKMTLLH